jgi:hypothetical protein
MLTTTPQLEATEPPDPRINNIEAATFGLPSDQVTSSKPETGGDDHAQH